MASAARRPAATITVANRTLRWILSLALLAAGCANIQTRVEVQDIPNSVERQETVVPNSPQIVAQGTPIGEDLVLRISSGEWCTITETPVVHRIAHERRTPSPSLALYEYGGAVLFGALGAVSIADASGLANSAQGMTGADPTSYQVTGGALIGVGVAFLIAGIVDSARAADRDHDEGLVSLPGQTTEGSCHLEKVPNAQAKIVLRSGKIINGTTDADSTLRLELHDVAVDDMPDSSGGAEVAIGNHVAKIRLDDANRQALLAALLADPSSRSATDAATVLRRACDEVLSTTRRVRLTNDLDVTTESATREAWARAPGTCEHLWTPEHQAEASKALASMDAIDAARAERQAAEGQAHLRRAWDLLHKKAPLAAIQAEREKAVSLGATDAQLDAAVQVKENQELVQRWTTFASRCARLGSDKEAIERVRNCDANCRKILAKVEEAWEKLQSEQPPAIPTDVSDAQHVKEICEKAGCPACPQ